jgi:hypothetical protein
MLGRLIMGTPVKSKIRPGFCVRAVCLSVALALSFCIIRVTIAGAAAPGTGQTEQSKVKSYPEMSEDEQKQFIAQKAQEISAQLGNSNNSGKITPEAVAAIKPHVDAYAKRIKAPIHGCDIGRENLSEVLLRYLHIYQSITLAFESERNPGKTSPTASTDREAEWLSPQVGVYLAMVESEFCQCLQGPTGLGWFQLTRENATRFGLKIRADGSSGGDERCNVEKSATVAAKLLKSLVRDKDGSLKPLIALARYHRGANAPLSTDDRFWDFVARREFKGAISEKRNQNAPDDQSTPVETQAFEYVRRIFAAAVVTEYSEFFDASLPSKAQLKARMEEMNEGVREWIETMKQVMETPEFQKEMKQMLVFMIVMEPEFNPAEWLKNQSPDLGELSKISTDTLKKTFAQDPVGSGRNSRPHPALNNAPAWLTNLTRNLDLVRDFSARITSHRYRHQTVYYLRSNFISVLYDVDGKVLCALRVPEGEANAAKKCPDFNVNRRDGKLVWQSARTAPR